MKLEKRNLGLELNRMANLPKKNVKEVVFHHSATPTNTTVESINNFHKNNRGWAGIGYHVLIEADGTAVEGRPLNKEGVHAARPANGESWAVCLIGNFEQQSPTEAQYETARRVWHWLTGLKPGLKATEHKDHMSTACPGRNFDLSKATAPIEESKTFYRVVTGSFENKKNAENRVKELERAGFRSFITTFTKE